MTFHRHEWTLATPCAVGRYSKRGSDSDALYFEGVVERCECGQVRFKAPGLQAVSVEW